MTVPFRPSVDTIKNVALIIALILLSFAVRQCSSNADAYKQSKGYLASLNDTITHLKSGVVQKPATEINSDLFMKIVKERDDLQDALAAARLKAKNVRTFTEVVSRIETEPVTIQLHDTMPCPEFTPIPFAVDSQYYSIRGSVGKSSVTLSKISMVDSMIIFTAEKKHFLRPSDFLLSVKHSNPLIKTTGMQNITIVETRKWWQNPWLKFGAGAIVGSVITKELSR